MSLVLYLIDNNPSDIILDNFRSYTETKPKTINFDIFKPRKYEQVGIFDTYKAFRFLFPGNFYKYELTDKKTDARCWWYSKYDFGWDDSFNIVRRKNKFKSYEEYEMMLEKYKDDDNKYRSIYKEDNFRVTQYLGEKDFTDKENIYKYLFFNTGIDPQYESRFGKGNLGFARFNKQKNRWVLDDFNPAISLFGYFGCSTMPYKIVKLNENTIGFYIKVVRDTGPTFGDYNPIDSYSFILIKYGNKYKRIFVEEMTDCKNTYEMGGTEWKSEIVVENDKTKGMYNLRLEINGLFDPWNHPYLDEYKNRIAKKYYIHNFKILKYYKFNGKNYEMIKEDFID